MTVPGSRNTETASALRTMSHHGWTSKLASVGPADATAFSSVGRMAENPAIRPTLAYEHEVEKGGAGPDLHRGGTACSDRTVRRRRHRGDRLCPGHHGGDRQARGDRQERHFLPLRGQ